MRSGTRRRNSEIAGRVRALLAVQESGDGCRQQRAGTRRVFGRGCPPLSWTRMEFAGRSAQELTSEGSPAVC